MKPDDFPLPIQIRLRTIEALLAYYGYVSRSVLGDIYGLGSATVSRDIALYKKINSDGCFFNSKTRRIEKISGFKRVFKHEEARS